MQLVNEIRKLIAAMFVSYLPPVSAMTKVNVGLVDFELNSYIGVRQGSYLSISACVGGVRNDD
jgi:hypothetical protein